MAYAGAFVTIRFLACLESFALASFIFAYSINKDWKIVDIPTLDKMLKTKQQCEMDIFKQYTEFVRSHSNVKQLSIEYTLSKS